MQQLAFKIRIGRLRGRVLFIPDREFSARERLVIALDHWLFLAQFEMAIEPGVKARARNCVIVMRKVLAALEHDVVRCAEQGVKLLQFREPFGGHFFGPVVGGGHALGLGREQTGELDVAGIDTQEGGVFASAAALHGCAYHHRGEGQRHARVNRGEKHGLRAAAAGAGHGNPIWIDLRQAQEEIERPDGVPRLQAHDALQVRLGLRAEEAPVLGGVHLRTLLGEPVHELHRKLLRIRVAKHVPLPDHTAHARQLHAQGLEPAPAALLEALLSVSNLAPQLSLAGLREARVGPMPMRKQDPGRFACNVFWAIEIARHEEARRALEEHLLHRIIPAIYLPMNDRIQRRPGRHRPQTL